jgi:two-component sensor histidine kinase
MVKRAAGLRLWITDLLIGIACAAVAFGFRLAIDQLWWGVVLFPLVFPAVVAATLLSSWRAGLFTIIISQVGIWYALMPPRYSFDLPSQGGIVSLLLTTATELLILIIVHDLDQNRRRNKQIDEQRIADLQTALEELDHRTMNNFQLAIAMLQTQMMRMAPGQDATAIETVMGRLGVLAAVHRKLVHASTSLTSRDLARLIDEILVSARMHAEQLPDVAIVTTLEPLEVSPETALRTGLIVNELVTNALKYAFPDGRGRVSITLSAKGAGFVVQVADNGIGRAADCKPGSGSRLVAMLASSLGGQLHHGTGPGTCVSLHVDRIRLRDSATDAA